MADAAGTAELVARLLTAEAALVCRPFAGAVALAAVAAGGGTVAVPRSHMVQVGDLPLPELLRLTGTVPVGVGDVDGFAAGELAAAAPAVLLIADRMAPAELAAALWACRSAGVLSVVAAGATMEPLALLDGGADLVLLDVARHHGGPATGVIAGGAELVAACARQRIGALFRADADELAGTLAALKAAAGDPAAGRVMPLVA